MLNSYSEGCSSQIGFTCKHWQGSIFLTAPHNVVESVGSMMHTECNWIVNIVKLMLMECFKKDFFPHNQKRVPIMRRQTVALKVFSVLFPCCREAYRRPPRAPSLPWRTWTCPRFPATSTSETSISKCRASPRSEEQSSWALQGSCTTDAVPLHPALLLMRTKLFYMCIMEPQQLILPLIPFMWTVDMLSVSFEFYCIHFTGYCSWRICTIM